MIRLPLLVLGVALAGYGSVELYHASRNREQATVTCDEVARGAPRALWIRATGCEIDYMGATWRETRGQVHELFMPVRPAGHPLSDPIAIVAATTDPEVLAVAQGTVGDNRRADQESFTVMGLRIVTILKASREIEGYARHGAIQRALTRRALTAYGESALAPAFVVVDLHARPQIVFPAVVTAAGVAAVLGGVLIRKRRRSAVAVAPAPEPAEPAMVPEPAPATAAEALLSTDEPEIPPTAAPRDRPQPEAAPVPAMMLLNLPASAGIEAIERAPALGSRSEVTDRIGRALPGIHFDDRGRATWTGREWSLAIDLGRHEPVWTVTVEARGSAALEAAQSLATRTGWRIYVPKRGAFILDEQPVER